MEQEFKDTLVRYLQAARDGLLWKLEGVGEYDVRRPLTPTGTNLLGLVKHCAWVEAGYFGETFGRPFPEPAPWDVDDPDEPTAVGDADEVDPNVDLYAAADESRDDVLDLYRRVQEWSAATIDAHGLDALGRVPWWAEDRNEVTLHQVLVHVTAEVHHHAGHADILRELLDGAVGLRPEVPNLPRNYDWPAHVARVEAAARDATAG